MQQIYSLFGKFTKMREYEFLQFGQLRGTKLKGKVNTRAWWTFPLHSYILRKNVTFNFSTFSCTFVPLNRPSRVTQLLRVLPSTKVGKKEKKKNQFLTLTTSLQSRQRWPHTSYLPANLAKNNHRHRFWN
jgi:hypothetical protein